MCLHFTLQVNGEAIGLCTITRVSHREVASPTPDLVCVYEVDVQDDRSGNRYTNRVEHRYGDGPWALAEAALSYVSDLTRRRP